MPQHPDALRDELLRDGEDLVCILRELRDAGPDGHGVGLTCRLPEAISEIEAAMAAMLLT